MIIQVVLSRPVLVFLWGEYVPIAKGQNVAWQVLFDLHPFGNENLILIADTHQALIKRPVAEAAKGKAVCGLVIMCFTPGFDVGRLHALFKRISH